MTAAWRFVTDCATGLRHWRWYARVGRPDRSLVWPCTKAAALALPLALPAAAPLVAPGGGGFPVVSDPEYGAPFATGPGMVWPGYGAGYAPAGYGYGAPVIGGGISAAYPMPLGGVLPGSPVALAGGVPAEIGGVAAPAPVASGGIPLTPVTSVVTPPSSSVPGGSTPGQDTPVPEPASALVLLVPLAVLVWRRSHAR